MKFSHKPVLFKETIDLLNIKPDGIYVDGTAGGGGHSSAILDKLTTGKLISIDQDPDAIKVVKNRFNNNKSSIIVQSNFSEIRNILSNLSIDEVDGVLLDIGVSSYQLDSASRGFSYNNNAYLDMRMSKSGISAYEIVNTYSWQELAEIISKYGEEKSAKSIAKTIEKNRKIKKIETTFELAEIVKSAIPSALRREGGHPARKTFQAIRIAVNDELNVLERGLDESFSALASGGRLVVITFHSLEDRIVKKKMQSFAKSCTCPPDFPICVCQNKARAKILTKKPIEPSSDEVKENPRSRSAKLRGCAKI